MRLLAWTLLLVLAGLGLQTAYVGVFANPRDFERRLREDIGRSLASVQEGPGREALRRRALRAAAVLGREARGGGTASLGPTLTSAVAVRVMLAAAVLPLFGAALLLGIAAGLLRRHRLREGNGYSSVTFSYVGKFLVAAALAGYVLAALSPAILPLWSFYLAALGGSAGAAVYVGCLPPRL